MFKREITNKFNSIHQLLLENDRSFANRETLVMCLCLFIGIDPFEGKGREREVRSRSQWEYGSTKINR